MWRPSRNISEKSKGTLARARDGLLGAGGADEQLFCTTANGSISNVDMGDVSHGDASGSRTPPKATPSRLPVSSPSDDHVNMQQLFSKLDALVGDVWQSPPASQTLALAVQPGQPRKPKQDNDATNLSNIDDALYRSQIDAECSRKQLQAAMLERDSLQERLIMMQQRSKLEPDVRESLKAEFRTGLASMQQQLSDILPVVVNEMRSTLQSELMRLQSVISQASVVETAGVLEAMQQRLIAESLSSWDNKRCSDLQALFKAVSEVKELAGNSHVVVQQLTCLNSNLNKFAGVIHETVNSKADADFSVVLKAIRNLEERVDVSLLQKSLQSHKVDIDSHFSYISKLIRDCNDASPGRDARENKSMDLSSVSQELKSVRLECDRDIIVAMRKLLSDNRSELESSLLRAIAAAVPGQEQLTQVHESMRGQTELVQKHLAGLQSHAENANGLLGRLHETVQEKHRESTAIANEVNQLLNQMSNTLEQPRLNSGVGIDPVLKEIADLQGIVREHCTTVQKHHEDANEKLSRLHDVAEKNSSIAVDLEPLRESMRVQSKHHEDTHARLSRIHDTIQQKQSDSPGINQEVCHLLEQMKSTMQQQPSFKPEINLDAVLRETAELRKHHEESNAKLSRLHEAVLQKTSANVDFEPLRESMRIQSETFLNGLKGVQNDSVLREISDLQGNVRQIHKHNEDTHERLSRIHDAVQEKQKGSPAINQEVGQLLEMDGKMHQAGLKSDYLDPMLRDIAALRSTVQEIQKHHVDTNDRLSRIHDAFHEKQKESPAINKDVSQLLEQMGSTLQQPVLSDASLDPVLAEIAELQSNVQTIHKHHEEKLLPAIQKHHDDNLAQLLPNIQRLQRATETLPELKNSLIRIQDDVAAISKKLQQEFGSGTADRVFVDLGVSTPNVNQDEKGRDQFRDLGLPMASQSQDEKVPVDLRSENAFEASSDRRDSGSDRRRSLGSLEAW